MAAFSVWVFAGLMGAAVFIPMLVIALVRLPTVKLAIIVSMAFSVGAVLGFVASLLLGAVLHLERGWDGYALYVFVGTGTIGGAALALTLLRRFGGIPGGPR